MITIKRGDMLSSICFVYSIHLYSEIYTYDLNYLLLILLNLMMVSL